MLEYLHLTNVGPAPEMELELASRLNLITGDNGLGKSFLLDVAWWALTRRWPQDVNPRLTSSYTARPTIPKDPATIEFRMKSKTKSVAYTSKYIPRDESWLGKAGRPWNPGLVIYAQSDGSFSVWDPARNYWKTKGNVDVQERLPGYVFSPKEVWDGLNVETEGKVNRVCNGLLADWANWIREKGDAAKNMKNVLSRLSPSKAIHDRLEPGPLTRISVFQDARDIPSLKTGYSKAVPILHASSGVRRVAALAYMLLWSWQEHRLAARQLGEEPAKQVILLIDELECHLHPRWQRSILRSLLDLARVLHRSATIQIIAATHSPLVLASAEPFFDAKRDAWFDLDLTPDGHAGHVDLRKRDFVRLGDISNWLTSEAFDLKEPRSIEAEEAITEALDLLRKTSPSATDVTRVNHLLKKSLSESDRFWGRWSEFRESREAAK
ncbi:MAG: ATP-binding protein [Planctomycetota bacterium]|nr:ATP-binding protein [Planctomycetota bacterium]